MPFQLRDFEPRDAADVDRVAAAAFEPLLGEYADPDGILQRVASGAKLAEAGEMIVATVDGEVAGAVTYVGPGRPKAAFFEVEWPVIRMLVVSPAHQGRGIGRALTEECIRRARRDGAPLIALHTTPVMKVALPMYLRMGFEYRRSAEPIFGVEYGVYTKGLAVDGPAPPA